MLARPGEDFNEPMKLVAHCAFQRYAAEMSCAIAMSHLIVWPTNDMCLLCKHHNSKVEAFCLCTIFLCFACCKSLLELSLRFYRCWICMEAEIMHRQMTYFSRPARIRTMPNKFNLQTGRPKLQGRSAYSSTKPLS